MARYHFNLYDGIPIFDEDGFEFSNLDEVRKHAIHFLGAALIDGRERIFLDGQWRLDVTDERNSLLFSVNILAFETGASSVQMHHGLFNPPDVASAA